MYALKNLRFYVKTQQIHSHVTFVCVISEEK